MSDALAGLVALVSPLTLLLVLVGTVAGMAIGAMPGLSATMGLALLVPFTFAMDPGPGLVLLGAFYMGAIYGGSFTAILVNAPGTPSSIATAFEGYRMTKQGRSEEAIVAATVGSVVGGLVGVVFLIFLAPPLADFSLRFGPQEYFWVAIFGLTIIVGMSTGSVVKGLIGGALGVLLGTVGISPVGGDVRFTFGEPSLQGGVPLVPALIGLFTIPEVIKLVARRTREYDVQQGSTQESRSPLRMAFDLVRRPVNVLRSSVIGSLIGILPGAGGSVANLVAYNEAKRTSKARHEYGRGSAEGVVAAESANNGTVGGGFIPTLTLGVPGTPPDAIVLGVLLLQGLRPGADLFTQSGDLVYTFAFALALSALMMAPVGLIGGRALQRGVVRLPARYLAPAITVMSIVGAYAIRSSVVDVVIMLVLGVLAYFLGRAGIGAAPIVLGLVLGPIAERGLVQGLLTSTDQAMPWLTFFTRPLSIVLILMTLVGFLWPLWQNRKGAATEDMVKQSEGDRS
ncbi:Tricarboxylate transport membrane protein TctA [Serinicoccus hydrothermalis]|uniref:Tricarboxylate transport membrane protein TctA n=1 Tax=Serinicoccus hydrothermalis TaxID=1758689 RepID=A0A1B1N9L1_9MICO|nr:tripartite tricarboxylate transporter permease [Serinicoccus hydrothermalis]ANS78122.1 Tricarboxylate transport membrane protein TctA [Serinicoccus hydrothermalis]